MKITDYTSLLSGDPAELVLMSTYNFDPDFFERRILRASSLAKARRIIVLMDLYQWQNLQANDVISRWLNTKYLVVPVKSQSGVFHPKLQLIIRKSGFHLICGSGNLTRAGCTHNLEFVNSVPVAIDDDSGVEDLVPLCGEAVRFFQMALQLGVGKAADVASAWLTDLVQENAWCSSDGQTESLGSRVALWHTLDGPLWPRLKKIIGPKSPKRILVTSPFYDPDARLISRTMKAWPSTRVEIVAQQLTSSLPVSAIQRLHGQPELFEVLVGSRRLHAKMVGWQDAEGQAGAIVGSANFTTAAYDGRNVEACLVLRPPLVDLESLFGDEIPRRRVPIEDFEAAKIEEPRPDATNTSNLVLRSAVLRESSKLELDFSLNLDEVPSSIAVALRVGGESLPRCTVQLSCKSTHEALVEVPPKALQDVHGTVLASLFAQTSCGRVESMATWVIQEERLTHEHGKGSNERTRSWVQETGDGLPEFLDELGKHDGVASMVDYLDHLNIRFADGDRGLRGGARFRLRRSDPFHPDLAPEWWNQMDAHGEELEAAIYRFCDRHEKKRLRRHADRGNINGIGNFLDIFSAVVRLLYVYLHRTLPDGRTVVKTPQFIGRTCRLLSLATCGIDKTNDICPGYLKSVQLNLSGELTLLHKRCEELNFAGHMHAVMLVTQDIRYDPNEVSIYGPKPTRPRGCLIEQMNRLNSSLNTIGLATPSTQRVAEALERYRMLTETDLRRIVGEYDQ